MGSRGFDFNLDPPPDPESWPCNTCLGEGYIGCVDDCFHPGIPADSPVHRVRTRLCLTNHYCPMCKGEGCIVATEKQVRDEEYAAGWERMEAEREERMTDSD